ncbi:hypothetical protein [Corynebacterium sp. NML130628]|uniref:hypothetical protein n=1 Tax=Corynebacterium sp. NML130628 TaxID=1906333 RepID=UPI0008FB0BAE|nr:hypothetical protein [Corynebacterium sp. NML130628]OIR40273.1 hypothetical protein BJP07_10010 [Corynebacterium sp. NML130628]
MTRDAHRIPQFDELLADDVVLTQVSRGEAPNDGTDQLLGLMSALREDVERPMPVPPYIAPVAKPARKQMNPWLSGLVGAAAATALVAGSGAVLYNATPDSPLWPVASTVFGERASVMELASTLDEMEVASDEGNEDAVRSLVLQAKALLNTMDVKKAQGSEPAVASTIPEVTVTRTVTVTVTPEPREPVTVTHVVTEQSAVEQHSSPQPTASAEPSQSHPTTPATKDATPESPTVITSPKPAEAPSSAAPQR